MNVSKYIMLSMIAGLFVSGGISAMMISEAMQQDIPAEVATPVKQIIITISAAEFKKLRAQFNTEIQTELKHSQEELQKYQTANASKLFPESGTPQEAKTLMIQMYQRHVAALQKYLTEPILYARIAVIGDSGGYKDLQKFKINSTGSKVTIMVPETFYNQEVYAAAEAASKIAVSEMIRRSEAATEQPSSTQKTKTIQIVIQPVPSGSGDLIIYSDLSRATQEYSYASLKSGQEILFQPTIVKKPVVQAAKAKPAANLAFEKSMQTYQNAINKAKNKAQIDAAYSSAVHDADMVSIHNGSTPEAVATYNETVAEYTEMRNAAYRRLKIAVPVAKTPSATPLEKPHSVIHLGPQIAQPSHVTIASLMKNIASTHKNMLKLVDEIAGNNLMMKYRLLQNLLRHEQQSLASLAAHQQITRTTGSAPAREVSTTLSKFEQAALAAEKVSQGGGQFPGCPACG